MDADQSTGQRGSPGARATGPLVGRAQERVFLREELAATFGGRGRLVLLGGVAGIGKTSLARDLTREADELGVRVLLGHCYDLTNTPPYGPWLNLFGGDQARTQLPVPPAAFAGGRLKQVTDQSVLFAEVRRFFAELTANRPAYVLLEDLHWADPASIELLRHIAPHVGQWRMLLVATYRVDDLTRSHPLYQQLPALVREADGARLDLRPLDVEALSALVAARYRLTGLDEARLIAYLERHAEGNPFFTIELLRALQEEGLLRHGTDRSSLGELARVVVPPLLRQVIDGRVARLGEETRQPLAIAAVIGQEVPLDLWATVAGLGEDALLTIVERAVEAHLVEANRDGTSVRFVHALTREALYDGVLPPRRRLWHRRVAETLAALVQPDPDAVAYHFQQVGDPRAAEWLERAGDRAQRAYAWLTAIERFQGAADLLDGIQGAEQKRGQLLYRVSRLQRFSDPVAAIPAMEEAARLAARLSDVILAAEVRYHRGILLCYSGRFRAGIAEMAAGIEALEAMPLEQTLTSNISEFWLADSLPSIATSESSDDLATRRLHEAGFHFRRCPRSWMLAVTGHYREAVDTGERYAAALAEVPGTSGSVRSTAGFALHGIGISHAGLGQPEAAKNAFAQSRTLFGDIDHHALLAFSYLEELRGVASTYEATDPERRRRLAAEAEAALRQAGGALQPGLDPRLASLHCLLLDGRWHEASEILEHCPDPGHVLLHREITLTKATLASYRGEPDAAWAAIRASLPDGPATEPGDALFQNGLVLQRLAVDLCLDAGNLATARAWLEAHDQWLAWSESVLGVADGQLAWSRWYRASGDTERAGELASDALQCATAPDQPLVRLRAHRRLGELAAAARQFDVAEAQLTTARDLTATCEVPFERAQTLLSFPTLHLARGECDAALTVLTEVRDISARLGAAPLRACAEELMTRLAASPLVESYPAGLTQREVEVLRLLAGHRTDKEIAAELFIGARTVQSHVANILGKLGVDNRRAAAAEALRLGLV